MQLGRGLGSLCAKPAFSGLQKTFGIAEKVSREKTCQKAVKIDDRHIFARGFET
jgi:hypothetical protein